MAKGRSNTVLTIICAFSLAIMFLVSSRQFKEARLASARDTVKGTQVVTVFDATKEAALGEEHVNHSRYDTATVVRPHYTCDTNTSADFDTEGNPCFDIERAATRQSIYAVNTKDVSYVYCSIPKNGCTYHLGVMHRLLGFSYEGGGDVHERSKKERLQVSPNMLQRMLLDPNVEKYMVVRNPLERVLSAYFDKVERHLPANNRTPKAFEEWVYKELTPGMNEKSTVNPHWKPQVGFCGFSLRGLWKRFRWFTVEEPAEYVDYLEELLPEWVTKDGWNGRDNSSLRQSVLGPRKRTGNTSEKKFQYVPNLELFDYLVEAYRVDIEGMGYQKAITGMRKELLKRINKKIESTTDGKMASSRR